MKESMANSPNATQLEHAIRSLDTPGGRQRDFLQKHYRAPGRALTMTRLAQAARYKSYRGANLQYGLLANRIGKALGNRTPSILLLVDVLPPEGKDPRSISNAEWILVMRPAFATALRRVGWVS